MNEIVKYNSDLNYMPMPNFTGRQMDLFFAILSQIKDEHDNNPAFKRFFDPNKRQLVIPYKKFVDLCRAESWNRSFVEVYNEIESFLDLILSYKANFPTPRGSYHFVCFEAAEHDKFEQTIKITFQKQFYEMVVNLKLFTRFELAEFISLSGKYTKTLYKHLKQYRNTGFLEMKWDKFKECMNIPNNKQMGEIERDILKPVVKELTAERNLFDSKRIPFKNLTYEKIKGKGRGRGGNVIAIKFRFSPEIQEAQELKNNFNSTYCAEIKEKLCNQHIDWKTKNGEFLYVKNVFFIDNEIKLMLYDSNTKKDFTRSFTKEFLEREVLPFIYI